MKCWYDNRKEPYFYLMPIKVEMHADDPELYTFHDVISDEEIEAIKNLAKPLVIGDQLLDSHEENYRLAKLLVNLLNS